MSRNRLRAFSLIELLVVIGLIAILGSLLLIGIGHLITNSKRQATQLAFQNCQSMYAEWDRIARMHFPSYRDPNINSVTLPCPQNVTLDYFNNAALGMGISSTAAYADREGYISTSSLLPPDGGVLFTRDMMSLMHSMPVNATSMGKLSASATMTFNYTVGGPGGVVLTPYAPPMWAAGTQYSMLNRVQNGTDQNGNPLCFVCIRSIPYTSGGNSYYAPTSDAGYWFPAVTDPSTGQVSPTWTVSTVPVLLDGWGNPIIFVSSGSLGYPPGSAGGPGANNGMLTAGGSTGVEVQSPDGRPFWASAGPDGDFSLGDDNMYSFEK